MDLDSFRHLLTKQGQEVLAEAERLEPREVNFLAHFTALSRRYPADLARAALETAILRREAVAKFAFAEKLYFTREALEQASPHEVSVYRSRRFQGFSLLLDLACSIGADSLALATIAPTVGVDLDRLRLSMARANLCAQGLGENALFVQADLTIPLPITANRLCALFFDPARREAGRRIFSVQDYHPPLNSVYSWLPSFPAIGVKISPGVDLEELAAYDAEVEFISLDGELKEATLWFGPLKSAQRRATVLPGEHTMIDEGEGDIPLSEPQAFIYEPDPAILRARLVTNLGARLEASQLDPEIAYLTGDKRVETPFARSWRVEAWLPFQLKRLRAHLRERGVGRVTVKKRGSPIQPEAFIRDLRLRGDDEKVLFLTQLRGKPIVIVATP